jgi:hypothetical protein
VTRVWLDAVHSGDTIKILDHYRRYQPERIAQGTIDSRFASGGFELVSIERSEPRHIEVVVKERNTPMTAYGILDLAPSDPPRVTSAALVAMGPNVRVTD